MRILRSLLSNLFRSPSKRDYAHVHDVQIKWDGVLSGKDSSSTANMALNVFKQPLALHSTQPLTGFTRTGYCEVPPSDAGNHAIAGIVSKEFLDFSAARGNDLRQVGLTDGCKWCLCVSRWKEAFDARTGLDDKKVPKVVLKATNEKALRGVSMEDLKKFAVDAK
ncbi:hypothetical protein COCC4DRAFT_171808 [Bipolaris maydis ATCC 48331]|uniref:Uncharacterized protein n=2 Tax=Cochliobolus heterostrophus TaxID=5016 RepID=M2UG51_COCH5|nr:uncharacterized protein COCC4DRAFT_171808 [Bipolaris maydis ATCC 48331]EMD86958.1 hypothetical protein COCHEDRAFT_1023727 [Bipolaris maydis C5]KAJ5021698.1 hypothetical protein J3E73DRAFT_351142 [Bipolaris maydis]ENI04046.1 hypothetical protein COCC4DRAFT_171808 [Bipolaris maydis ATCC 48331]KAJ5055652.1 hypothetical protein J3E74DRAFT_380996 [Bipolaris maydis]KAJ6192982.1 hypothetical protein J3E72DRAFT_359583 [Bipolaris maydis]